MTTALLEAVGGLLERARERAGLSRREASRRAGISHTRWGEVARGKGGVPRQRTLAAMALAVRADPVEVFAVAGRDASAGHVATVCARVCRDNLDLMMVRGVRQRELGRWLREWRVRHGQSVRQAARDAGVSDWTWSRVENGAAVWPRTHTAVERVCRLGPGTLARFLAGAATLPEDQPATPGAGAAAETDDATGVSSGPHVDGQFVSFLDSRGGRLEVVGSAGIVLLVSGSSGVHMFDADAARALGRQLITAAGNPAKPVPRRESRTRNHRLDRAGGSRVRRDRRRRGLSKPAAVGEAVAGQAVGP